MKARALPIGPPALFLGHGGPLFRSRPAPVRAVVVALSPRGRARADWRAWVARLQVVAGDQCAACRGYGCRWCSSTGWTLLAPLSIRPPRP